MKSLWIMPATPVPLAKPLIDHEGVGFMLRQQGWDLKQAELIVIIRAPDVLDSVQNGSTESSMAKVVVSEALMRVR